MTGDINWKWLLIGAVVGILFYKVVWPAMSPSVASVAS